MRMVRPTFFQRYGLTILAVVAFCLPMLGVGSMYAIRSNRNDVKSWLPEAYEETKTFKWYWDKFGGDAFVLASWEGCVLGNETLPKVADEIRRQDEAAMASGQVRLFRDVMTGEEILNRLIEEYDISREDALARLRGSVIGLDNQQTCLLMTIGPEDIEKWDKRRPAKGQTKRPIFHAAVERVYQTGEQFGISRDKMHMGGPPVDNVAIDIEGERSMIKLAVVCALIGLMMSWWAMRSWQLTLIVSTTAIFSAGLSLVIIWISGRPMNAIVMTMPALVFVGAASGAIHLANYYRDALKNGQIAGAADRALKHAWLPLALATGTTAVGLASLGVSELTPIQMFGIFSGLGVVGSFLVLCTYMPSLLEVWRPPVRQMSTEPGSFDAIWTSVGNATGRWIIRHHNLVTVACLVVMAVGTYGITRVETSVKLMRLFSPQARILQDYAWLEKNLGPLVPVEVVLRMDAKDCNLSLMDQMKVTRSVQRAIEQMPDVGSTLAAPTFAPYIPKNSGLGTRATWDVVLNRSRTQLHDYWSHEGDDQLWRVSARVAALTDLDYGVFVQNLRDVVDPLLQYYSDRGVKGITATYTGVVPLVYKAQHSMFDGLILGFTGDLILICIAIIILMRNWSAGPLLMFPSVFPLVFVFGAMGLMGIVVDTGTVMAPAVALGVTVDDAIHFMLWCRRGEDEGMSREDSIMYAYGDCTQAIYQSWAVIGLGISAFAFSAFMPTRRFGILMITMLTVSSVGNLVFLPALLQGPAGRWFWRRKEAKGSKSHHPQTHEHVDVADERPTRPRHLVAGDVVRAASSRVEAASPQSIVPAAVLGHASLEKSARKKFRPNAMELE
jgi:uncharacterized protein